MNEIYFEKDFFVHENYHSNIRGSINYQIYFFEILYLLTPVCHPYVREDPVF